MSNRCGASSANHLGSLGLHCLSNLLPIRSEVADVIDKVLLLWHGPIASRWLRILLGILIEEAAALGQVYEALVALDEVLAQVEALNLLRLGFVH